MKVIADPVEETKITAGQGSKAGEGLKENWQSGRGLDK